jgi:PAS domain S-box-containing protein
MTASGPRAHADFLSGAGEMGSRIRSFDWDRTPLGPIENWPRSLKTSVSLILGSRHPMWIGWGREMTFLYNDAYLHVLGTAKHPRALGLPASRVWPEIWNVCGPLADKVFENGEATFMDDVRLFMDRGHFLEETFYSFSYSPIRDDTGQVCGLFCPSTDVTAKVLSARRLATLSELSANALLEKTTAAACATAAQTLAKNPDDLPFAFLYLAESERNRAWLERAVGNFTSDFVNASEVALEGEYGSSPWPIGEVYGTAHRKTIAVGEIDGLPCGVADQRVVEAVVLPVLSRGENRPYGVLVAGVNPGRPLDADHLTFFELVASQVATAIQNARNTEEEKKRADMLAEIDRAKTVFFSNVSHEFRTPLTLMLGPLENLLAKPDGLRPEDYEELVIAHRNSLRLLKLVNSLLDFSRLEAGRLQGSYTATDLADLTRQIASNFRSAIQTAGLELIVDCEALPEPVYVDREMWEKIVLNLLSNAFKFTFAGRVTVRLRAGADEAVLTVSDTGIGIPEEELPRIFERFYRVEGASGRTYEGTGIGLALIQEYAKLHSGSISAESRAGEGSTFTVTLPFGAAHLPGERVAARAGVNGSTGGAALTFLSEAETWLSGSGEPEPGGRVKGPRVLLADDNADMREHVSRILGAEYDVVTAKDGEEAWELIRRDPPDLLVSDLMMPGLDGFALLHAVRSEPRTHTLPVIFLSARAGQEMRIEGLQAGADDYLVKPFTAAELRARVGTHVQMALARRRATEREAALRAEAEAARDEAETLNEVSRTLAGELDLHKLVQTMTDAATRITGAQFGAYYSNAGEQDGAEYMLHALAGAPPEAFANVGLARNAPLLEHTFRGGGAMRSDDIAGRPEYGDLPVRSYLAVPVISRTGEVLGGLFFGHSEAGVFTGRSERLAAGIASHAAVAIDNAHLFAQSEREIARRTRTEDLLRRSEERFRQLADSMPQMVWTARPDGYIDYFNERWYEFTGRGREEFGDGSFAPVLHPEDFPRWMETWYSSVRSGEPVRIEYRFWDRQENRWRWFMGSALAVRDASGEIAKWFGSCTDFDEQKRVEDELRRANQDLEQFAYSASHDLQEPLRSIKIYGELLTARYGGRLDGQAFEFLDYLRTGASRMEILVRDLLAYTQVTKFSAPAEAIDANEALLATLAALKGAIEESAGSVVWDPLPSVAMHSTHLKLLFQNLIGNAVKYRHPERAPEVKVAGTRQDGCWVFSVRDNGIGIEPEYKEHIFGLFRRLHTNDEYSGTGIGLAICQRIVERYHGRIWVESTPGEGSTFVFTLPI